MNVNTTQITNVYVNRTVIVNNESHVAFNGGQGGVAARPTPEQESYAHQTHTPPVAAQVQQEHAQVRIVPCLHRPTMDDRRSRLRPGPVNSAEKA